MIYIAQKSDWDCGVAALAMAVGESYDTILNDICGPSGFPLNELYIYDWCIKNGWAWQLMYVNRPMHDDEPREAPHSGYCRRDPWPPEPFAPSHICMVQATRGWHFCVLNHNGVVYDPWSEDRYTLNHPDYKSVSWVLGLWKVA